MTLYTHQRENITKTWVLMLVFFAFITFLGYFASYYYNNPGIFIFAVILSVVMNIGSYWFSDKIALSVSGAHQIEMKDNPELWRIAENISITAGLPMPKLYIINDASPNAFATGRNKNHSAIAVTTGLLERLDKSELEGVIAHEFAHIGNRDILLQSVIVVLVGLIQIFADWMIRISFYGGGSRDRENNNPVMAIAGFVLLILSPIIAIIIQLAISRRREFLADTTGALITRYPEGLASALRKISDYNHPMVRANKATAHMFISTPLGGDADGDGIPDKEQKVSWVSKLFNTHPPIQERIDALLGKK
ncbi:MAG: Protease HtpX [Candidatus Taylorbacteria bacterium]|nr:Protease HtpX [Candidatus Taylorbacteria bacterium]